LRSFENFASFGREPVEANASALPHYLSAAEYHMPYFTSFTCGSYLYILFSPGLSKKDAMSWANHYIEKLKNGETVQFRPRGNSMKGKVESGQLVTVEPKGDKELQKGDIVLCKVNGSHYLHLIKAIQGERYQIGNNIGRINGWITQNSIYGICTNITA
jgi:hypothetical protein